MDNEKEISFGVFDSELMRQEIFIPEGFEATIDGDKIILKKIESEDEMIKQKIIKLIKKSNEVGGYALHKWEADEMLAWLKKQDEKLPVGFYYVNSEGKKFYSDTFKYGDVTLHVEKAK